MTEQQGLEEKQFKHGAIHDGQCNGNECGGVFVCPSCGRLCGWCFGGAPDPRCDACVVEHPEQAKEYQGATVDIAMDSGSFVADVDRILMSIARAKLLILARRFFDGR